MAFRHSKYTDARQSHFNEVGRDLQNNYTIYLNFSLFGSRSVSSHRAPVDINHDPPRPDPSSSSEGHLTIYRSSDAVTVIGNAIGLIVQITSLLNDRNSSNNPRDFMLQLKSLNELLTLTRFAIDVYNGRPLEQSLAHAVTPEVVRCSVVLQGLLATVKGTCHGHIEIYNIGG
jgi:hypothetical protein